MSICDTVPFFLGFEGEGGGGVGEGGGGGEGREGLDLQPCSCFKPKSDDLTMAPTVRGGGRSFCGGSGETLETMRVKKKRK